jgi:hypothetical protein
VKRAALLDRYGREYDSLHLFVPLFEAYEQAASIQDTMSAQASSSTATTILRNDDPLTQALRNGVALEMSDIVRLDRVASPISEASLSFESPTEDFFSAQDKSATTKPTSIGTSSPNNIHNDKGKGRAEASNASSLSVACGSASEAEIQRPEICREALLAMGDWATSSLVLDEPLRGTARAKARRHRDGPRKFKKPVVEIIQHNDAPTISHVEVAESTITVAAAQDGSGMSSRCF